MALSCVMVLACDPVFEMDVDETRNN